LVSTGLLSTALVSTGLVSAVSAGFSTGLTSAGFSAALVSIIVRSEMPFVLMPGSGIPAFSTGLAAALPSAFGTAFLLSVDDTAADGVSGLLVM
jgi:hypothetical protein